MLKARIWDRNKNKKQGKLKRKQERKDYGNPEDIINMHIFILLCLLQKYRLQKYSSTKVFYFT